MINIENDLLQLIMEMLNNMGNSPKQRLIAIYEFINKIKLTDDQRQELLNQVIEPLTCKAKEHTERGSTYGKKKTAAKTAAKKRTFARPSFVTTLHEGKFKCATCDHIINSCNAFIHLTDGVYKNYCALPECFPEEFKAGMLNDRKYSAFLRGEKLKVN